MSRRRPVVITFTNGESYTLAEDEFVDIRDNGWVDVRYIDMAWEPAGRSTIRLTYSPLQVFSVVYEDNDGPSA